MKTKSITITLSLILLTAYAGAQPCTDQAAKTTKGSWRKTESKITIEPKSKATTTLAPTLIKKAEQLRVFFEAAYPNPIGCDIKTNASLREFPNIDFSIGAGYRFDMSLIEFYCDKNTKKILPNEYTGSSGAEILVNTFELFLDAGGTGKGEGEFEINGVKTNLYLLPKSSGTIKGHKVYEHGNTKRILYTHDNKFPFKTITREQYLNALLKKQNSDVNQGSSELDEVEAYMKEQLKNVDKDYSGEMRAQMKREYENGLAEIKKQKEAIRATTFLNEEAQEIQKYLSTQSKVELQKPACVLTTSVFRGFFTEAVGGQFLVIKDHAYMKKDLPAEAAQMILLKWNSTGNDVSDDFVTKFEANFPFDKIQVLIDK